MKYISTHYFKDDKGQWHSPGDALELEREEASVLKARGLIVAYQTQMVSPPETRVLEMPKGRRRRNA